MGLFLGLLGVQAAAQQDKQELIQHIEKKDTELNARDYKLQQLQGSLKTVQQQKAQTEQEVQQKAQHEADLQKQIDDLNAQLQAKRERQASDIRLASYVKPSNSPYVAQTGGCVSGYATGNYEIDYMISVESSGNSCATNPGGCFGLLQACPGAPLRAACGGEPACQIEWFASNKLGAYHGSWHEAYQHERAYGWW